MVVKGINCSFDAADTVVVKNVGDNPGGDTSAGKSVTLEDDAWMVVCERDEKF